MTDQEERQSKGLRRGIKICLTLFLIAFILAVVGFLLYLDWMLKTPIGGSTKKYFEVKKGESSFIIASNLKNKGLIRSDWIFFINNKIKGGDLLTGVYEISPGMSIKEIFAILTSGQTKIVRVTIPEGYRTEQIGQLLEEKKLGSYEEFVTKAKQYEGELFPDTYYFSPENGVDLIIEAMKENFAERTQDLKVSKEDLIIASIVEREAIKDEERPLIAGIYKNRIQKGMKLEADPTVQYGKDNEKIESLSLSEKINYHFWQKITLKEYKTVDSPYNTYLISSLPPGPICNPGIKSIRATINFDKHNYIYFLQNDGKIYPSETEAEHNQNRVNVLGVKLK